MSISTQVEIGSHDMNAVVAVSQFLAEFSNMHNFAVSQVEFQAVNILLFCEYNAKITLSWLET